MKTNIFTSKQGPIEYSDYGSGKVILALHGAMGGYDQSEILAKTIAPEGYRVIAVSRPGYLGTPLSSGKSPDSQADLYYELLNHLKITKCMVAAVSGGGYSAIFFAHRYPAICNSLILCSTPGVENDSKIPISFRLFTMLARVTPLMRFMKKKSEQNFEVTLERAIINSDVRMKFIGDKEAVGLYKGVALGMFENIDRRIAGTRNDIQQTQKLSYPLHEIQVPTLIIHGTDDSIVPYTKHAEYLAKTIPNAVLFTVERGEHAAIFTHCAAVRARVQEFLSLNKKCHPVEMAK